MANSTKPLPTRSRHPRPPSLPGHDVERREEGLTALFILGCVLFSPLVLTIFHSAEPLVAGMPPAFIYLFGAWAALIAAVAVIVEVRRRPEDPGAEAHDSPRTPGGAHRR